MLVADQTIQGDELARTIQRQIIHRTFGRVQYLDVAVQDGRVRIHGLAPTYYLKQLTLTAVREVSDSVPVDLDVEVVPGHRQPPPDWDLPVNHS